MAADPQLETAVSANPENLPTTEADLPDASQPTIQTRDDGSAPASTIAEGKAEPSYKLKFCTVCASNNNRSMEAHYQLSSGSYPVISFGTGSLVRLPGPSITQPNVFNFDSTSYNHMYEDLYNKDQRLYRNNGILNMLDRNRNLKWGPERFQNWVPGQPRLDHIAKGDKGSLGTEAGVVDVIITCEERCWDAVVDDLLNRGSPLNRPVHVFNVDIRDNHEEALLGGKAIRDLADRLNAAANEERRLYDDPHAWDRGPSEARHSFDERVPEILAAWQEQYPHLPALWTLSWF
ncbi:transcription/RNA-processing factor Ssu72 [Talaromyces stipitatus ATCC 10500]|uniref:RNA polymerase II subunit A C-terminal domain phosphatase SSU72 n=1 Tax=Talaromyces stipitatus (strain ATCC 10500 / CBS 375.48 / QM 6759 / NRRL 1006) TaxID=441959 RepID=B8M8F3_TALSN|nr:transcription/RNA-processing factor Ssu72 [Talaromyces stipitatus ATCC 10500]EED20466.1 transcription/RNA-processing factor Ssu72 [Talaromyces stipitatus ATCC 10500]